MTGICPLLSLPCLLWYYAVWIQTDISKGFWLLLLRVAKPANLK